MGRVLCVLHLLLNQPIVQQFANTGAASNLALERF
jgi:hypothetical protein